jgi:uncharacterized protein YbbC (DUF1343 family)
MPGGLRTSFLKNSLSLLVSAFGLFGCSASQPPVAKPAPPLFNPSAEASAALSEKLPPVMLGIDVLEADGFAAVRGKRIGLLTHPAGVNRRGVSTIDVLRRAPGVKLVMLYAAEHGLYNNLAAEKPFTDSVDPRTGLKVISLYAGHILKPTPAQLKPIDALVIDLQDIGTRSYTFTSMMKTAMEACFENGKEVIILDRPNPLGGLKVDGPLLDPSLMTDVGRFRVPYVHGLTIGELARMVKEAQPPGGLAISDAARARGKLTVIPMRGWTRSMRWPETGLTWVPTSALVTDWAAVEGYPMVGLGCILGGFTHGIGKAYAFRGIHHDRVKDDVVEKELRALNLPGVQFRSVSALDSKGRPATGLYVEISDYDAWQPTELNFYLMKLACKLAPKNPFATATKAEQRTFKIHVGSEAFFNDLVAKGARIDIESWLRTWREQALVYQEQSKRFWLYR